MDKPTVTYEIVGERHTISSTPSSALCLNKVAWNGRPAKLELRRWTTKGDDLIPAKGVTFSNDEEVNTLTETLVDMGYGDTNKINESLAKRSNSEEEQSSDEDHSYFSPKDLLGVISANA